MNKIFKFAALLSVCLMAFAGCTPEEISTDQYSDDAVTFVGFAPNPVARGGALRITGSNLQKVTEVHIPGIDPITDIEVVTEGKHSEIRVIVPVDGPEVGKIAVVAEGKTLESLAELTYSEPIFFNDFSPKNAMPGDEITLKGDYLNNIRAIHFEGGAIVTEFPAQGRYEMKVVVPATAVTGKLVIADVDEDNNPDGLVPNLFYSEADLVIGKPTVTAAARGELKAGDEVTVKGQYLNMIQSLSFAGVDAEFTAAEDGKSIVAALPESAGDGDLVLVSYAGDEFPAGAFTTKVPTELAIAAETRYKAGLNAVVTGNDLDLVTGADLAGTALDFGYDDEENITFAIPAAAVDGVVTLALANGKTVATEAIELVKPVITSVTPLELYAGDENVVVAGQDMDLVTGATLGGRAAEFEYADGAIIVKTELTSVSGKVVLILDNGVAVESADAVTVKYHSKVIVTEMPAMQHIGQEVILKGSNFSLVENIFIGDVKVTQYSLRTDEEVRFLMPWNKAGMYSISFHLFEGDVETVATQIEVGLELDIQTIWEGSEHITWTGMQNLAWGGFDWSVVKPGTVLTAYFTLDENPDYDPQIRFADGNWNSLPTGIGIAGGEGNIIVGAGATYYSITLTAADLEILREKGLVMTGTFYTLTKMTLTSEISQEVTLWEGELVADDWASQPYALSDAGLELAEAGAQPGQIVYFYFEQIGADPWKVQIVEGHWGPTYLSVCAVGADTEGGKFTEYDLGANGGKVGLTLTQEMLDAAYVQQWWGGTFVLNGDNTKCTKITIL